MTWSLSKIFSVHLNDTTKLSQKKVSNKSPLDSENGLSDILETALVNETTPIKWTEWTDGMKFFKHILLITQTDQEKNNFEWFFLKKLRLAIVKLFIGLACRITVQKKFDNKITKPNTCIIRNNLFPFVLQYFSAWKNEKYQKVESDWWLISVDWFLPPGMQEKAFSNFRLG